MRRSFTDMDEKNPEKRHTCNLSKELSKLQVNMTHVMTQNVRFVANDWSININIV